MKAIEINGLTGHSVILVGERLQNIPRYLPSEKVVVITDTHVSHYYQRDFPSCDLITIGTGEEIKNLDTVSTIYERLLAMEVDRSGFIVGIGGGIVCDITGFVASTYLRGVRFGFVSSTLLSQVDASIGGKNGVNVGGYKNMVGVFKQPEFVICDMNLLKTLPKKEVSCGFAEIVKHAAIGDARLFAYLEKCYEKALDLDRDVIQSLVYDSVLIKSSIVNRDEKEKGERRKLNFGHTIGHAIEKCAGLPHGEAVSVGMAFASSLSVKRGHLSHEDRKRLEELLKNFQLPTRLPLEGKRFFDAVRRDKKRSMESINVVLLQGIGRAIVEEIPIKDLERAIEAFNGE
ncbi:MAG: 3-dehydroquinate synthase [Pseudomonadota bacterium]